MRNHSLSLPFVRMEKGVNMKCLYPKCTTSTVDPAHHGARGLCFKHYTYTRNMVLAGITTWEKLEKAGKTLATQHAVKRRANDFKRWLLEDK